MQKSRFLDFDQLSNQNNESLRDSQVSMDSLDLSMISPAESNFTNDSNSQVSVLQQINSFNSSRENSLSDTWF